MSQARRRSSSYATERQVRVTVTEALGMGSPAGSEQGPVQSRRGNDHWGYLTVGMALGYQYCRLPYALLRLPSCANVICGQLQELERGGKPHVARDVARPTGQGGYACTMHAMMAAVARAELGSTRRVGHAERAQSTQHAECASPWSPSPARSTP